MKINKKKLFFLCLFFCNFGINVYFEAESVDELNEEMKNADTEYKNSEEIVAVQSEIEENKEQITMINNELKATKKEVDELNAKIPIYEEKAGETLKLLQKVDNSSAILSFVGNILEEGGFMSYLENRDLLIKLGQSIKEAIEDLLKTIEELKEKQESLETSIESLKELERELTEKLDTLEKEQKQKIVGKAYQRSVAFYNEACYEGQIYGRDCGDELEEGSLDDFIIPIKQGYVTNEFGGWDALDQDDGHTGIDITTDPGMSGYREVYPSAPGQVVDVFADSYGGIQVMMIHYIDGKNYITNYAHLESVNVLPGDIIDVDDQIGVMGETGVATGIHLHFEIIEGPYYIHSELENPRNYVVFPVLYQEFITEERK